MLVRLGFSLMTQVDADVLLIDEVLAVGDASFQQKCFDAFSRLHGEGRTIVLVTHDMTTVRGPLRPGDDPRGRRGRPVRRAGRRGAQALPRAQLRVAAAPSSSRATMRLARRRGDRARSPTSSVVDAAGARGSTSVEAGSRVEDLGSSRGASRTLERPIFGFQLVNADGLPIFAPPADRARRPTTGARAPASAADFALEFENPLARGPLLRPPGARPARPRARDLVAFRKHAADFVVFGTAPLRRLVRSTLEPRRSRARPGADSRMSAAEQRSCSEIRGPSALRRRAAALLRPALADVEDRVQARLPRHGARLRLVVRAAADAVRRPARRLHAGLPVRRATSRTIRRCCCSTSCSSPSSRRRPSKAVDLGRRQRERGSQDAVPAPGDPALGRAHERAAAGAQPDRRLRLPDRLRRRAGLDLDPLPADHPRARAITTTASRCCSRRSTCGSATSRSSGPCSRPLLFYATPILYPIDQAPSGFQRPR